MTAQEKARELVNTYYGHSKSQLEAIEICERIVLTNLCQQTDSLHSHACIQEDYDNSLILSSIRQLKYQQEIALELSRMKNKLPA
jgi:menaquinone-dependent protoporphyrinogen IX oxidase